MSLATEMANVSKSVRDVDDEFKKVFQIAMDRIKEKAMKGDREISFYDIAPVWYDFENPNRNRLVEMLKSKLEEEGFRYRYGYQIGKPLGNSQSEYIVW